VDIGFVDQALDLARGRGGGQVEDGSRDGGHGDPIACGDLVERQCRAVEADARLATPSPCDRHLKRDARPVAQTPQLCRGPMAQHRPLTAGEDRGHPAPVLGDRAMAYPVHTAVVEVQPFGRQPVPDRAAAHAEPQQLSALDKAVLAVGQLRDQRVPATLATFGPR
jgi:hypothetical protein